MALTKLGSKTLFLTVLLSVDDSNKEVYDQYYNTASNIKLTSLLATDTVDVLITVPQMFSYYTAQNACLDLSSFLSEDLYEKLEKENRLLTAVDAAEIKSVLEFH